MRVEDWLLAGADTGSKVGMADEGLGGRTIERKERDDGQGEVDDGSPEPICENKAINENGKRCYNDEGGMNGGKRRESRRIE